MNHEAPRVISVRATEGDNGPELIVIGANFTSDLDVHVNGVLVDAQFVDEFRLTIAVDVNTVESGSVSLGLNDLPAAEYEFEPSTDFFEDAAEPDYEFPAADDAGSLYGDGDEEK